MKYLLLCLAFVCSLQAQITQSIVIPATGKAENTGIPAQSGDCRVEILLQNWTLSGTTNIVGTNMCGLSMEWVAAGSFIRTYWLQGNGGTGLCVGNYATISLTGLPTQTVYIRSQKTIAGGSGLPANTYSIEAWDSNGTALTIGGVGAGLCTFTAVSGSPAYSSGTAVGNTSSATVASVGFYRGYSTLSARGAQMPVTTPTSSTGLIFQWKFDNSLGDSSGNSYAAALTNVPCTGSPGSCYASTGSIQNLLVSRPQFSPTSYSNWISMRTGVANTLNGSTSFSQNDASSVPAVYLWAQNKSSSGCPSSGETVTISNTAIDQPTVTPTLFGALCFDLSVTDANGNTVLTTLKLGAVNQDVNGVVTHSEDVHIGEIFGPQIAFGKNPWSYTDKQNKVMIDAQIIRQATVNDFGWAPTNAGTISYPFAGKGFGPGPNCTTLSSAIPDANATTIAVTDATCLSLSSFPTWIMVGSSYTVFELIRICSTVSGGTTGAQTLNVCYDGRGLPGGIGPAFSGFAYTSAAQGWPISTKVGEFRIQGTSTQFSTDPYRPICPAGVPGPQGQIAYQVGTVQLTAGSFTIPGTSTVWNNANGVYVGGFIRVAATHSSTSFIYWARITAVSTTSLTVDRPAPTGVDSGMAFNYKITARPYGTSTSDIAMTLSLEFTVDSHTERALFNGMGCESDTVMFATLEHDITGIDSVVMGAGGAGGSGLKYSYKLFLNEISNNGTPDPNFYGTGLAARNFYYRSGYGPALDLANSVDEYWVRDPQVGGGYLGSPALALGGGVIGAMADLVLNASTVLTWPNVEKFAVRGEIGATACNSNDSRENGANLSWLTLAANYDTNATNQMAYQTALRTALTRDQTCRRTGTPGDGYSGAEINSFANSFNWGGGGSGNVIALTNGSATATGPSTTLAAAITSTNVTSMTVASAAGYPTVPFTVRIDTEQITITAVAGVTWTITRGANNSTAATHTNGTGLQWFFSGLAGTYANGYTGSVNGYCMGIDTVNIHVTHNSSTFTVNTGVLTQQTMIWFHDGSQTGVFEYLLGSPSHQLSGVWSGATADVDAMSTGGGRLDTGGQRIGGYGSIWTDNLDWPTVNAATALANNQALEKPWACKVAAGGASMTLYRTWDGPNGTAYHISYFNLGAFAQQPFMVGGYKTNQMVWATKSADSTISTGYAAILPLVAEWYNTYGWDYTNAGPSGHGSFYGTVNLACGFPTDIPAGTFASIHGYQGCGTGGASSISAGVSRVNSSEGGMAMLQYYLASPTPARKAIVDTFYGAIVGNTAYCDASVLSTCDGTTAILLDDASMAASKWPGFYFGMGGFFLNSWPAVRLINIAPASVPIFSNRTRVSNRATK